MSGDQAAFPSVRMDGGRYLGGSDGLTVRAYFSAHLLGFLIHAEAEAQVAHGSEAKRDKEVVVNEAVVWADLLIARLRGGEL